MTRWGSYEAVKELAQSGLGFLWTARRSAAVVEGETYVIKTTEGLALLGDPERLERESTLFMEAANAQVKLVELGAKHWARLHEVGRTDVGAYYVTDMYARSVQSLVARGIRLDARSLSVVVHAVIDGLQEIGSLLGRAHGNIKRSNVLIGGPDGPTVYDDPVVLTDPKPTSALTGQDGADDLRAVGRLIYELVMLRPVRDQIGLNVSLSEDWSRLGAAAPAWVDLCNLLMGAAGGRPAPDLEQVRAMIPTARAAASRRRGPAAAAAVALLVIGGGVAAYVLTRPPAAPPVVVPKVSPDELDHGWVALVYDWKNWYQPNTREALRVELEKLDGAGQEGLRALIASLGGARPVKSPSEAVFGDKVVDLSDLMRVRPSEHTAKERGKAGEQVQSDLSATMSAVREARQDIRELLELVPASATAASWGERGWGEAAAALTQARRVHDLLADAGAGSGLSPERDKVGYAEIADAVRAALAAARAEKALAGVEQTAKGAALRDPALKGLTAAAQAAGARALAAPGGARPVDALAGAVERFAAAAGAYAAALGEGKLDLEAYLASPERAAALGSGALDAEALTKLTAAAGLPAYRPISDPAAGAELARARQEIQGLIAKGEKRLKQARDKKRMEEAEADKVGAELARIAAGVKAVGVDAEGKARVLSPASNAAFTAELGALRGEMTAYLEGPKRIIGCDLETEAALRAEVAKAAPEAGSRLRPLWDRLVESMVGAKLEGATGELDACDKRDLLVEKWKPVLEAIAAPGYLPGLTAPGFPAEGLEKIRRAKHEALLDAVAAEKPASLGEPQKFAAAVEAGARAGYEAWRASAERALADAARAAALLAEGRPAGGAGDDPAQLAKGAQGDAALAPLVKDLTEGLAQLEAVGKEDRLGALLDRLEGPAPLAVRVAAWARLGSASWAGADAKTLERAAAAAAGIGGVVEAAGLTAERKAEAAAAMRASAAAAWTRLAAAALETPDDAARTAAFDQARVLAGRFGAGLKEARGLSPRAGYAWLALEARAAIGVLEGASPGDEGALVARHAGAIEAYAKEAGLAGEKDVADLIAALRNAADPNGKSFDESQAGPLTPELPLTAQMGWKLARADDGGGVVEYVAGGHRLAFVTLKLGGAEEQEVLISTREVSAGLAAEVLSRSSIGADAAWTRVPEGTVTLLPMPSGREDPREGPRAWTSEDGRTIVGISMPADRARQTWFGWFPWKESLRTPTASFAWLPSGVKLDPPTLDHPMQQVTAEAAVLVARRLGCRLPTAAEWRAAASAAAAEPANLRDADWRGPRNVYVQSIEAWNRTHADSPINKAQMPSGGIFVPPDRASGFDKTKDDGALEGSDGSVLFRPAKAAAGEDKVHDLIGNVAEFVLASPEAVRRFEALPRACQPDDAFGFFATGKGAEQSYGAVRVIGGSAISPPPPAGWDPSAELEVRESGPRAYSDVGFRLAISKGEGSTGKTPRARALNVLRLKFRLPR